MRYVTFILASSLAFFLGYGGLQQGITGTVRNVSGNHMPAPNRRPQNPGITAGVKATVCVFELTNLSQVIQLGSSPYYRAVSTRLVRRTETDSTGNFSIPLPPGIYSVFTQKGDLFFATRRDEKNNIAPVEVKPGKMTRVECSVESDHKGIY
jgi:hypothetical protein